MSAPRPISKDETDVIRWLLENASTKGSLSHLRTAVDGLEVVSVCECGCPTMDFMTDRAGMRVIADAHGSSPEGISVGVILWGKEERIAQLEVYSESGEKPFSLPAVSALKTWDER